MPVVVLVLVEAWARAETPGKIRVGPGLGETLTTGISPGGLGHEFAL